MSRLRTPTVVPVWLPALCLAVGFGAFVWLLYAGHDGLGLVVILLSSTVMIGLIVADAVVARSRSKVLRAQLTAADVAARVDLNAVAAALRRGPTSHLAGVRMVQQAFPQLFPADAIEVTRTALPGLLPPRPDRVGQRRR